MAERELGKPDSVHRTAHHELWGYDFERVKGRDISFLHYLGFGHLADEPERKQIVVPISRGESAREDSFLEAGRLRKPITLEMLKGLGDHLTQQDILRMFGPSVRITRDKGYEWWAYDTYNSEFTHYVSFFLGFSQGRLVFRPIIPATVYSEKIQLVPVSGSPLGAARSPAASEGVRVMPDGSIIRSPLSEPKARSAEPNFSP